jgi:DNA repair exonuclease SbcCD ATPase subunit
VNPRGNKYCDECGARIVGAHAAAEQPYTDEPQEVMRLKRQLLTEQDARRDLQQQIDTLTREIATQHSSQGHLRWDDPGIREKLSAAEQDAAAVRSQLLDIQEKWKSAEEKNLLLERQLTEGMNGPEPRPTRRTAGFLMTIVGLLAVAGVLLGFDVHYRASHPKIQFVPAPANEKRTNELSAMVTKYLDQISSLQAQLDAANQDTNKLKDELAKESAKEAVIQKKLDQAQGQLNTERNLNSVAVKQVRDQLESKTQEATRLRQQANDIAGELAALKKKHPSWNYVGAPEGTLRWQGELKEKEKNINIVVDQTGIHVINARNPSSLGSLPTAPFGWKQVVVNADGKGKVTAQLLWSVF